MASAKNVYPNQTLNNTLNDPNIEPKKYWSTLNELLHKRKIPNITPIWNITNNNIVTDVTENENIFNTFLTTQCSLIDITSVLPSNVFITDNRLNTINFDEVKLLAYIRVLDANKALGWNLYSACLRVAMKSLVEPFMKVFHLSLAPGK